MKLPFILLAFVALSAEAGALRTRFAEATMSDVPIGVTVSPLLPDGTGYSLVNDSDEPLRVRVTYERPSFCEPVPHGPQYQPLPASCKVAFDPEVLDLAPHSTNAVLVTVAIPDDPALAGRHFELWVRAEAFRGQAGVALVSRIRLDTRSVATSHAEGSGDGAPAVAQESHAEFAESAENATSSAKDSRASASGAAASVAGQGTAP